jgi:hypothetical protein
MPYGSPVQGPRGRLHGRSGASDDVVAGLGVPCRRLNTSLADDNRCFVQETDSTVTLGEIVRRWTFPNEVVTVPSPTSLLN